MSFKESRWCAAMEIIGYFLYNTLSKCCTHSKIITVVRTSAILDDKEKVKGTEIGHFFPSLFRWFSSEK